MTAATIAVTVVWATADAADIVSVAVPVGSTVAAAIAASGLVERHGIDLAATRAGLHGRLAGDLDRLADGDRVEICRPLIIDPKDARRLRAEARAGRAPKRPRPA